MRSQRMIMLLAFSTRFRYSVLLLDLHTLRAKRAIAVPLRIEINSRIVIVSQQLYFRIFNAENLEGKLMLAHGSMDSNVPPNNTLLVVEALMNAGKDFDMLLFPNSRHGFRQGNYWTRRRWDYFVRHLLGVEPPREYVIGGQ